MGPLPTYPDLGQGIPPPQGGQEQIGSLQGMYGQLDPNGAPYATPGQTQQQAQQKNFWTRLMQGLATPNTVQSGVKPGQNMGHDISNIIAGLVKLFGSGQTPQTNAPTPGLPANTNYDPTAMGF